MFIMFSTTTTTTTTTTIMCITSFSDIPYYYSSVEVRDGATLN